MHSLSNHFIRRSSRLAILAALGGGLLSLAPCVPVQAQAAPASGTTKTISLNLVNQPVQTALRLLFTSAGLNNSIDAAVQGNVTIDVNDVSFDTALNTLLRANTPTLTYDKIGGVYHITVLQPPAPVATADQTPPATTAPVEEGVHAYRIPIDHYDAYMIAELVAGVDVSSGGGQNGGQGGRRGGGFGGGGGQNGNSSVLMVPANDVLASGGSGSSQGGGQQGGFGGGQGGGGFGGGGGGFGGGGGGFGGGGGGFGGGGGGFGGGSSGGGGFGGF